MASADLLRREEEFYSSLFDSAKGNAFPATLSDGDADLAPSNWTDGDADLAPTNCTDVC
jgi:hypothetical protein